MKSDRYKYLLSFVLAISLATACLGQSVGVCSSTALAPVFKQDFGQGASSTSGSQAPPGSTNYTFSLSNIGVDGSYALTPRIENSHKNEWTKGGDHTGNTNGNMFLVNAGGNNSIFFQQLVTGLCPGSVYNFSAWLTSVNTQSTVNGCANYLYPKVTFNIKDPGTGTILKTFTTTNLPVSPNNGPPNWLQYGTQFTLPTSNTSLLLEMVDAWGGGAACGNDLALDDIEFYACTPLATATINTATAVCIGSNTSISSSLANNPFPNPAYQWQKSVDGGTNWTNVGTPGTTAVNYALNNVTLADGAMYRVLVGPDVASLSSSTCVTASNAITLTVDPLTVPGTLSGAVTVCATANSGTMSLTGYTGNIVRWESSTDGGVNWNNIANTTASQSYTNLTVTTQYRVFVQSGTCTGQYSNNITITVNPATVPGTLSSNISVCASANSGTLSLTGYTGSITQWEYSINGGVNWNNITNITDEQAFTNLAATRIYRALVKSGVCASQYSNNVTVTVNQPPITGTLTADATVCATANSGTLSLTGNNGTISHWEYSTNSGTSWNNITNTTASQAYSNLTTTTVYRAAVQNGTCSNQYSNIVTITVNAPTIAGILANDALVCATANTGTLSLTGNNGNIVQWQSSIDNGTTWTPISNTTTSLTYNNLAVTTAYRTQVENGVCAPAYSNITTITVEPLTVAGTLSAPITVCASANSGTLSLTGYTGNVLRWEYSTDGGSNWTNIANTTAEHAYANLGTSTTYRVMVQNGSCSILYSNEVTVTVNPVTVPGVVSADVTVCATANNGTLSLTGYTGNIARWESSADGGNTWNNIANTTATQVYNNLTGTTLYRALIQSGVCAAGYSNAVTVTVNPATIPGTVAASITVCASANNGTLTLTGNTGSITRWESSVDGGANWANVANTTNTLNYTNLTTTTLYRTAVQNGACAARYSNNITITVEQPTIAGTVAADATVCATANNGTISLTGNTGNINRWEYSIDGGSSWNNIANTTAALSYNNITATSLYRALVQNGTCAAVYSNNVTIAVDQPTVPGTIGSDATVCATANSGTLSLTGNNGNIIQWESSIDNGNNWLPIINSTGSLTYNNLTATTLYRTQVKNSVCAPLYSNITTITVEPPTVAGTLSAATTVCANVNSGTLSLTGSTGNVVRWEYSIDAGANWTNISNNSSVQLFNNLTTTTIYKALVQNSVCAAQYSNNVTVTVDQPTIPGTLTADITVCASGNNGTLSLTGYTGNVINWQSSIDGGANWNNIANTTASQVYNNLTATTVYRATVQNGTCSVQYSNHVTVTVNPETVPGALAANTTVCATANTGTLSLTGNNGNIVQWESSIDNGNTWLSISNATAALTYNNLTTTTLYRTQVKNGVCAPAYSNITTVTVEPPTIAGTLSAAITVCASTNNGTLSLTGSTGAVLRWEYSIDGGSTWTNINNTTSVQSYTNLTATTVYRTMVQNGTCAAQYSNNVTITVDQPTVSGTVTADVTVCATANSGTLSLTGNTGTITRWESSTNAGSSWNNITNNTALQNYTNITATTLYRALVQNNTCAAQYSNNVTVSVNPATIAGILSADITVCAAVNNGTLSLTGTLGNIVRWENSTDNGNSWSNISNTTTTFLYNNLTNTTQYRVLVQNSVCASAYSNNVTVLVTPVINNAINNIQQVVCYGQPVTIISQPVTGGNGAYQYAWEKSYDNLSWVAITGANNADLTIVPNASMYVRRIINSLPCASISNVAQLVVQPALSANTIGSDQQVCIGDAAQTITGSTPAGGDGNYFYAWEQSIDNGNTWTVISGATSKDLDAGIVNATTAYRRKVTTQLCNGPQSLISNLVTITARAKAVARMVATRYKDCSPFALDSSIIQSVIYPATNSTYEWMVDGRSIGVGPSFSGFTIGHQTDSVTVKLKTQSIYGCSADSTTAVFYATHAPTPAYAFSDTANCGSLTLKVINNSIGSNDFTWDFGDGTTAQSVNTQDTITHTYTTAGNYQLNIRSTNNCAAVSANQVISVYPVPVAKFVTNLPDICIGDSLRLTNQSVHADAYLWRLGDGQIGTQASQSYAYRAAGNFSVTLIAAKAYGTSLVCQDSITAPINILATKKGSMKLSDTLGTCLPYNITAINLNTPARSTSWWWGDNTSATGDTAIHTYQRNGAYLVKMSSSSPAGCTYVDSAIVKVNAPFGKLSYSANPICLGQEINFTATITNDSNNSSADSIKWDFGDGNTLITASRVVTYLYKKAGRYVPRAELLKKNGCTVTVPLNGMDTIRVNETAAGFKLAVAYDCGKTTYQFIDTSHATADISNWKWVITGKDSSLTKDYSYVFNKAGNYEASLTVATREGCASTLQARFDVAIYEYPKANIAAIGEACRSQLLELKSTVNSQDSVVYRLWNLGNGANANDSIVKALYYSEGKYTVKLTVATVNNCFDSAYKQITVHATPAITIPAERILCKGDSIQLQANGAANYIWQDQNNNVICSNCSTTKVKPIVSTQYKVIGYSEYGCSEVRTTTVRVIQPLKMLAQQGDSICAGQSKQLFATGATSYSWFPETGLSNKTAASPVAKPLITTTYRVIGKDGYNCFADTAEVKIIVGHPTRLNLGKDTVLMSGNNFQLKTTAITSEIHSWRWSGSTALSCQTCPEPQLRVTDDVCISCVAVNNYGCVSSDTVCIKTFCPATELFVPNAFSPDGDGINDQLLIQGKGIKMIKSFRIFNRWGEVVFERANFLPGDRANAWDGKVRNKEAGTDVFVYVAEVICEKGLPSIFKGNVTLLK